MSVVDLQVKSTPCESTLSDQFVVNLTFEHENDDITEVENVVFPKGTDKAEIIEFINTLWEANDYIAENGREPNDDEEDEEECPVENYDKWCSYAATGLTTWPSDHNGNYFGVLSFVAVDYHGPDGTRFDVVVVE